MLKKQACNEMMNVNRHANIQVERIASISRLMEIGGKWKVLLQQSKAKEIFLTPEWITSWWKVFGTSGELYVLTIWADNDLIGVAPLYKVRRGIFRQLAFIGLPDHSDRVDFIYKEYIAPLHMGQKAHQITCPFKGRS